jgi:hypothetical protein
LRRLLDVARRQQVALLDEIEGRVLGPVAVLEAAIAGRRLDDRLGVEAPELPDRARPELHGVLPIGGLHLPELFRVPDEMRRHLGEGVADIEGVRILGLVGGMAAEEIGHDRAGALRQVGQLLRRHARRG